VTSPIGKRLSLYFTPGFPPKGMSRPVTRYAHSGQVHAAQAVARMVAAFPVPALVPALDKTARVTGRKLTAMRARAGVS
jgi:hypothetical protein